MASDKALRRIGIVNQTAAGWAAGSSYTKMLTRSLARACEDLEVELLLFSQSENAEDSGFADSLRVVPLSTTDLPGERVVRRLLRLPDRSTHFRGEQRLRHALRLPDTSDAFAVARACEVDVLLPLFDLPPWRTGVKTIGWIPDFQHVYLPEYFSAEERRQRDQGIRRLAERATLIMLSSRDAEGHFKEFAPESAGKARVLSFPSVFAFETFESDALESRAKFHLPEKFALVANQFWAHKNHQLVVAAIRQLKERGLDVPVVMTGLPSDRRDPSNQNFSRLLQSIAQAGLSGQVFVLGQVPYADLINLMRTAAVVIQPSRFEGWSTIVQDARALGRPLLCSDLPVHREQAPGALGFFSCDDPVALADLLEKHWTNLHPGPDPEAESSALEAERKFAQAHGQSLLALCREACASYTR